MIVNEREAAHIMSGARQAPVEWVETIFGITAWSKQREILESVRDNRTTAARSCHGIGKSFIAAATVLWFAMTHPRSIILTTATTSRQVKGILWKEIHALMRRAERNGKPLGGKLTQARLELDKDWWAWGFTINDYDETAFQGFHGAHVLVVVDEAAGVSPKVFEGLDAAMSGGHARMLMIGNPTDQGGDFGQAFKLDSVAKIIVSAFDTPNFAVFGITLEDIRTDAWEKKINAPLPYPSLIGPAWVRDKWEKWCGGREAGENDPRWQARVMGQFPVDGDKSLVPLAWIEAAHGRWDEINEAEAWPMRSVLGVDVARFGEDETKIADFRFDAGVREIKTEPKQDTMATAGAVLARVRALGTTGVLVEQVRVDADGLGAGVYDRLVETGAGSAEVREVRGGRSPIDKERFLNARAEMFWNLRELLDPKGDAPIALPPSEQLTKQLSMLQWKTTSRGLTQIESKEDFKRRVGRSPDDADAVAYAVPVFNNADVPELDLKTLRIANTFSSIGYEPGEGPEGEL